MKPLPIYAIIFGFPLLTMITGCNKYKEEDYPQLAEHVDIDRFMGTWYVHGCTLTFLDREAHNATETYEMDDKGHIQTTYNFRKGGFDGPEKTMRPVGKVVNTETNAEWRMRFFGLFSAPYLILYVDPDYQYTLVGHPNREMSWLMSRSPEITESKYVELITKLVERGYGLETFERIPQKWSE
jgi:apolipoprotein D and lipocalin family protein